MCDKTILKNSGTLKSFPECYKNQEMRNKTDDNYLYALECVSGWYKTRKMCDKQLIDAFLYLVLFLTDIKLKK